ncbi:putative transcriptional regulator [Desulfosporosinus orientis DSM 765]|uniref:Putative transcriptional regulator n=1 Tax=Desulfosporosinus orientis (strain ATCC 19365 / DSM 765 / NCIMB 8382 / VKM B-1628 / Singapore I) TaxID=768706 RepID=G7W8Y9_DESOD|nr:metalloregulator ArsR/SmtB family transcription factor [Desulfosporosinus orientis]AET68198.1 putative transcriptional regulator [Desulfosporosinus orientis DSM 765]
MNTQNQYERYAKIFKAFSDANRLMIIEMLQRGERCACEILEGMHIGQSTLSHHMKILMESGIVSGRPEGKWMYYSLSKEGCAAAKNLLHELTTLKKNLPEAESKCKC